MKEEARIDFNVKVPFEKGLKVVIEVTRWVCWGRAFQVEGPVCAKALRCVRGTPIRTSMQVVGHESEEQCVNQPRKGNFTLGRAAFFYSY